MHSLLSLRYYAYRDTMSFLNKVPASEDAALLKSVNSKPYKLEQNKYTTKPQNCEKPAAIKRNKFGGGGDVALSWKLCYNIARCSSSTRRQESYGTN